MSSPFQNCCGCAQRFSVVIFTFLILHVHYSALVTGWTSKPLQLVIQPGGPVQPRPDDRVVFMVHGASLLEAEKQAADAARAATTPWPNVGPPPGSSSGTDSNSDQTSYVPGIFKIVPAPALARQTMRVPSTSQGLFGLPVVQQTNETVSSNNASSSEASTSTTTTSTGSSSSSSSSSSSTTTASSTTSPISPAASENATTTQQSTGIPSGALEIKPKREETTTTTKKPQRLVMEVNDAGKLVLQVSSDNFLKDLSVLLAGGAKTSSQVANSTEIHKERGSTSNGTSAIGTD